MKLLNNIKTRDNNVELLRICLMFMIVLLHIISHGLGFIPSLLNNSKNLNIEFGHLFIFNFTIIGVNSFVLISGYYGIKFKFETLKTFWKQALMSSILILILSIFINNQFEVKNLIKSLFPIISNYWWYLSTYVLLFLLTPFINNGLEKITNRDFQNIVLLLFIFNCIGGYIFGTFNANNGYSILNFIFLYIIGRYFNKYKIFDEIKYPFVIYGLSLLINLIIGYYLYQTNHFKYFLKFYDYNNPLVVINSIFFVILFFKMKIKLELRQISKLTLGIYLFHDNDLVRNSLPSFMINNSILFIVFLACTIFSVTAFVEFLRQKFSNLIDLVIKK